MLGKMIYAVYRYDTQHFFCPLYISLSSRIIYVMRLLVAKSPFFLYNIRRNHLFTYLHFGEELHV